MNAHHHCFSMWLMLAALAAALSTTGCRSLHRDQSSRDLIHSRELTYSGIHAEQSGQSRKAENLFGRAVAVCPEDENARLKYAEALAARGAHSEAIAQVSQALQISQGDPLLAVRLGEMLYQDKQYGPAEKAAEDALRVNRKLASAWALKGRIAGSRQQNSQALTNYLRALTHQPDYPEIQLELAQTYIAMGKHARALSNLDLLAEKYPRGEEPEVLMLLHSAALTSLGRVQDAVDELAILAQRPNASPSVWYEYGQTLALAGDTVNARLVLQSASSQFPQDVRIAQSLANLQSGSLPLSMTR